MDKSKINLGAVRTYGHRAVPVWNFLVILLVWLGIPARGWAFVAVLFVTGIYVLLDVAIVLKQEQDLYFKKNPEFQRRMDELMEKLDEALQ